MSPLDAGDSQAMLPLRVSLIVGTRPEAIKLAPVAIALQAMPDIEPLIWCTGQHAHWAPEMLAHFRLEPDRLMPPPPSGQGLTQMASHILTEMQASIQDDRPQVMIVQGDTLSAFTGAVAAAYAGLPLVHVEAGLRSGCRKDPFPEEAHRRAIAAFADLHCAPTEAAWQSLIDEKLPASDVLLSGNTVIDALHLIRDLVPANDLTPPAMDPALPLVVVTCHRRENWGARYEAVCKAMRRLARRGDCEVAFVTHPNPALSDIARVLLDGEPRLHRLPPLAYPSFMNLLERAALVLTDSGGIQEEAAALGVPTLVLRDTTERSEGVAAGIARLVGTAEADIVAAAGGLLDDLPALRASRVPCDVYGDGRAAHRIALAIRERWSDRRTPAEQPQISDPAAALASRLRARA